MRHENLRKRIIKETEADLTRGLYGDSAIDPIQQTSPGDPMNRRSFFMGLVAAVTALFIGQMDS